jgi:putative aldouronate transport system substrate-binding protein
LYPDKSEFPVKKYGGMYLVPVDDTEIKAKEEKILKLGYTMIPAAIKAKTSEFGDKYDEYIEAVEKAGLEEVTEAYQEALDGRLELWK